MMRSELPNEIPLTTEFANVGLAKEGGFLKNPTFETKSTGTFVAPTDTQSQSDKDFNASQAAFDLANPAGTKIAELKTPTPVQTATAIENTTFNPTTPTDVSETVAPASKTQETGVKTTVSEPGKNWDSSVGREAEINSNLANITATNSQLLTDRNAYDKAFGYATADIGKKALLDSFFSNSGKVAKVGNDLNKYSSYSVNDFAGALTNGWITPSELSSLRSNPATSAKVTKAEELNRINKKTIDVSKAGTEATKEVLNASPTIAKAMSDGSLSPEELSALTETESTKKQKAELVDKKKEVDELTNAYESIETEVKKELGGKGVTSSFLNQVIANRQRELLPRLKLASSRYDSLYSAYSEEKKTALALFEKNFSLYQDEKNAQSELEKEKRKNVYDSVNAQIKFAMENGVDLQRTDANVVIADAEKYAKDYGVSFEEALKKSFTEPLTAKPSYKSALSSIARKNSGAITDYQKAQLAMEGNKFNWDSIMDERRYKLEVAKLSAPKWEEWKDENGTPHYGWVKPGETPASSTSLKTPTQNLKSGDYGGQCGTFAGKDVGFTGGLDKVVGKELPSRIKNFSDSQGVPGGLVLFAGGGYDKKYGHIAVVTGVNEDGTINVRESNFNQDEKVTERKNVPTTYVKGYFNSTPIVNGGKAISSTAKNVWDSGISPSGKIGESALAELNDAGLLNTGKGNSAFFKATANERKELSSYQEGLDSFKKASDIVYRLEKEGKLKDVVGFVNSPLYKGMNRVDYKDETSRRLFDDYSTLNTILGGQLAKYMQSISGATVSDGEVERLKNQVPNVSQSYTDFANSWNLYEASMGNSEKFFNSKYGFNDTDTARTRLFGESVKAY